MSCAPSSPRSSGAALALPFVALLACGGPSGHAHEPGAGPVLDVADPAPTDEAAVDLAAASQPGERRPGSALAPEADDSPLLGAMTGPSGRASPEPAAVLPGAATPPSKALLQEELRSLERLLQSTSAGSPDRLSLLLRLAQRYSSLASLAEIEGDSGLGQSARARAIEAYDRARLDYPQQPRSDEALYGLGAELLLAGERARGRAALLELIQAAPNSSFVPHAYARFGDLFFDEAAADSAKFALSRQAYLQVMKIPTAPAELRSYASYRLGWVEMNLGKFPESLSAFVGAIEAASAQIPMTAATQRLAKAARVDLVMAYGRAGQPSRAYPFLARYSGDAAGQHAATVALVGRLALQYADDGKTGEALGLGEELLTRHSDAPTCEVVRRVLSRVEPVASTGAQSARLTALRARLVAACGKP